VPFTQEYLEPAANLFADNYRDELEMNPFLPSRAIDEQEWILDTLRPLVKNPGVAVLKANRLIAYMITGFQFPFKGQNAVQVPGYCHGAVKEDRKRLYQLIYMYLAGEWAKNGRYLHIVAYFAHDSVIQETLYQLGFGALIAEEVRDFSPVNGASKVAITEEKDYSKLNDIHIEHMRYYPEAPIFISKENKIKSAMPDLKSHSDNKDTFLVYYEDGKPCAYFIVGTSMTGSEGFLLRNTNTVQIKGAYAQPGTRGKRVGKALLQAAVDWSNKFGYERLFVEHETANYYGGNFWRKHFSPYLYFSLRYIDNSIDYR